MGRVFKALSKAGSADNDLSSEPAAKTRIAVGKPPAAEQPASMADHFPPAAEPVPDRAHSLPPAQAREKLLFRREGSEPDSLAGWDERLVAAMGTASAVAEEFRRLRTHILHPPGGEEPARTILVVSTEPGEGKTFVCSGLATTLAQGVEGHALVIDCDLRRPTLAAMFGLGNEAGLTDHLRHQVDLGRLIRKTGLHKLSVLPSGPPPINPAELLGSEKFVAMISEVVGRYPDRYILFDSPPLRKAAETAILAKHVDGVVLVVRENTSRRENVGQLLEVIGPEKIIGFVYNDYHNNLLEQKISGSYGDTYYSSYRAEAGEG